MYRYHVALAHHIHHFARNKKQNILEIEVLLVVIFWGVTSHSLLDIYQDGRGQTSGMYPEYRGRRLIIWTYTVKPRCIVSEGDGKQKRYIRESDGCRKPLKTINKKKS
jgi:hypothetical protein